MIRSLRGRLLVATMAATAVVFILAGLVLYRGIRGQLVAEFDAALQTQADALMSLAEQDADGLKVDLDAMQMPEFKAAEHPGFFWFLDSTGKVVAQSPARVAAPALRVVREGAEPTVLPNGNPGRRLAIQYVPHTEGEQENGAAIVLKSAVLLVGRDTWRLDGQIERLRWLLGGTFLMAMLSSAGILYLAVRRGLHPLNVLAERIGAVKVDLNNRVKLKEPPTEMAPVVQRLNELLDSLQAAFARERAFTADVAHELRTPLAGLITTLEIGGSRSRTVDEYRETIGRCLGVSRDMHRMVENLLTLARADAHQLVPTVSSVELEPLLRGCWRAVGELAERRHLKIEWNTSAGVVAATDAALLEMVVRNLFENAVAYSPEGGGVRISMIAQAGDTVIEISNDGSQTDAADTEKVFDRFWRGDAARTAAGQHCGLGLSLCQRIVGILRGEIGVATTRGGQFSVRLRLALEIKPAV